MNLSSKDKSNALLLKSISSKESKAFKKLSSVFTVSVPSSKASKKLLEEKLAKP